MIMPIIPTSIINIPNATFTAVSKTTGLTINFVTITGASIGTSLKSNSLGYLSASGISFTGVYVNESALITAVDTNSGNPITSWDIFVNTDIMINDAALNDWNGNQIFSANAVTIGQIPQPPIYYNQNVQTYISTSWNAPVDITVDTSSLYVTCPSTTDNGYTITLIFHRAGQTITIINDSNYQLLLLNATDEIPAEGTIPSTGLVIPAHVIKVVTSITINGNIKFFG